MKRSVVIRALIGFSAGACVAAISLAQPATTGASAAGSIPVVAAKTSTTSASGQSACNSSSSEAGRPVASDTGLWITGLLRAPDLFEHDPVCLSGAESAIGLNDELWVQIAQKPVPVTADSSGGTGGDGTAVGDRGPNTAEPLSIDANRYVLFINGSPVLGLNSPTLRTFTVGGSGLQQQALVFDLVRSEENKALWSRLLGSPKTIYKTVAVALAVKDAQGNPGAPTIVGQSGKAEFRLRIISSPGLAIAVVATLIVLYLVWGQTSSRTTLRDNLLPQIHPTQQPFSLGRCQMAFWFVLIFVCFLFLYFMLWDYNTISPQALVLMGISGATALGSIAVDVAKDSPADAVNRGLQALGLNSHEDVKRVESEVEPRQSDLDKAIADFKVKSAAAAQAIAASEEYPKNTALQHAAHMARDLANQAQAQVTRLQNEIQDRENILKTYRDRVQPFVSQGWFADLTTDINGPTVHRLQVIFWTLALGAVFVIGVYRNLAMPADFSPTLLALMGLSGAGYVGFKVQENNN